MTESNFWGWLRPRMLKRGIFFQRIENRVSLGTPDLFWHFEDRCGWIELKYRDDAIEDFGARSFGFIGLSREQVIWLNQYSAAGGRCGVLLGTRPELYYWPWNSDGHVRYGDPLPVPQIARRYSAAGTEALLERLFGPQQKRGISRVRSRG